MAFRMLLPRAQSAMRLDMKVRDMRLTDFGLILAGAALGALVASLLVFGTLAVAGWATAVGALVGGGLGLAVARYSRRAVPGIAPTIAPLIGDDDPTN